MYFWMMKVLCLILPAFEDDFFDGDYAAFDYEFLV